MRQGDSARHEAEQRHAEDSGEEEEGEEKFHGVERSGLHPGIVIRGGFFTARPESGEREGGGAAGAVVVEADGGGLDEAADRGGGTGFLEECGVSP